MEYRIRPVYGEGFFHVTWGVIYYTIVFDYVEPSGAFWEEMRDPRARRREESYARRRMQELMDSERVIVNGVETRCIVDDARLVFRGDRVRHSMVFHARIPYEPIDGVNVYENIYEAEEAPYSYDVYWIAPPDGSIRSVETPGRVTYTAGGRIAWIHVREGSRITGYESVEFEVHPPTIEPII